MFCERLRCAFEKPATLLVFLSLEVGLFIVFVWRRIWLHCIFFGTKDWRHVFLTYLCLQRLIAIICNIGLFCIKASGHCNSNTNGGYIFKKKRRRYCMVDYANCTFRPILKSRYHETFEYGLKNNEDYLWLILFLCLYPIPHWKLNSIGTYHFSRHIPSIINEWLRSVG